MSPTRRRRAIARWEHVAMALGPRVPGAAGHPLGVPLFLMATLLNGLAVMIPGPQPVEWIAMLLLHLAFVAWMAVCDQRMRRNARTSCGSSSGSGVRA